MPESKISESLFDRYLAGDASPDEMEVVRAVLGVREATEIEASIVDALHPSVGEITPAATALERFQKRRNHTLRPQQKRRVRGPWIGLGIAATIIGSVVTIGSANSWFGMASGEQQRHATIEEYRTQSGQRARVALDDGSSVVLGPESHLVVDEQFGSSNRTVTLSGQALFTVTHQGSVPFVVITEGIQTTVLGTSFMVRKYQEDSATSVVVAQGRVSVGEAVVATGMMARAQSIDRVALTRNVIIGNALSWVDGELVLDEVSFGDVVTEMERWYGITIQIRDPRLAEKRVMTTLGAENMRESLTLVATALGTNVTFTGNTAVFGRE